MTRSITCKNCSTQFAVDLSPAPSNELTVACPKCGQKYKLRVASSSTPTKVTQPTPSSSLSQRPHSKIPVPLAIAAATAAVGTFLPWLTTSASAHVEGIGSYSSSFGSSSGISLWHGELAFLAALASIYFFWRAEAKKAGWIALAIPAISILGGLHASSLFDVGSSIGGASFRGSSSPGIGLFITTAAGIVMSVLAFRQSDQNSTAVFESSSSARTLEGEVSTPIGFAGKPPSAPTADQTKESLPWQGSSTPRREDAQATPHTPSPANARPLLKPLLIGTGVAALLALGAWWFFDLRHRHTLSTDEQARVEGWFKDIQGGANWVVIQNVENELPELSFEVYRPVIQSEDGYGNLRVELAIALPPYAYDYGLGRFEVTLDRRYDAVEEPQQVTLCNEEPEGDAHQCVTWSIITPDSMTLEFANKDAWPGIYSVIRMSRFEELRNAKEHARNLALVHSLDSIAQGVGLVRRGSFRSYACGDECGATFQEIRNGQPTPITYVCNTNRFGDVQLSAGDMLGAGDFTNPSIVGHEFLIVSKQAELEGFGNVWVIMGLLPFSNDQLTPELQQRLAMSANFDAGLSGGTQAMTQGDASTTSEAPPSFLGGEVHDLKAVHEQPQFPGGMEQMYAFMRKNQKYPAMESDAGIQGKVYIQFTVAEDGSIQDAGVLHGVSEGLDKEALRLIRTMPRWTPGYLDGKPVRCRFNLPVIFKLQ